ncbi:Phenylalanyl-tRNA synthetase alpha chain [Desulfurobacterium thermolithotrophum DSM 11699]|uniref:Phenylalanine--tRNA ligase alpha subunit n=1 Tax=Desulfurobacterium thermolithotrophum (strain DSM 11699 / BSA) TaxID=868864 RepID=F0S361_DESTD|nr:phenylalanine--tRNA ligase subunit alpha [Desulfurobacterium thermolithotrophum]ADY73283.1 Phenylalanyl-tRNA synthetase alpha chain [Desulfurobacterium thermolithotrophum DSM 11699]
MAISKINDVKKEILKKIEEVSSLEELEKLRVEFIGRKGKVTELLKSIPTLPPEERKEFGKACNILKGEIESLIKEKQSYFKEIEKKKKLEKEKIDVTLPGRRKPLGSLHVVTKTLKEIVSIFTKMGFSVAEGPEIETDFYNFEALNIPKGHPAREMQDTFYISEDVVLRTHTSPVQIRVMEKHQPPIQIIAPGKVYRKDADVTHTPMFHQVEGLMVDQKVTFADLKGVLELFLKEIFGSSTKVRFRPSYFPFTEPSAEVDIGCVICGGSGCKVCKGTGWLEILGCGMVDPAVFKAVDINPDIYQGFAFGMGVERIAMLKYGIDDLRLFFENDLRFLRQFRGM